MKTEKVTLNGTSTVETPATKTGKTATKAPAKKSAETTVKAEKKPAARKTTAKKAEIKEVVYLQYLGKEIDSADIVNEVKEYWTKELKKKAADITSITIYMKPEENTAYFVINEEVTGNIAL